MKGARYVVALLLLGLAVLLFPSGPVKIPGRANLPSPQDAGVTARKKDAPAPPQDAEPETSLVFLLRSQAEAWNRGDIEGFMAGYWKSDKTTFAGSSGVSRGWEALLDRYRRNYPDRAAMGQLAFTELEVTLLAPDAALILGHWQLKRQNDQPGGLFTLVSRRFPEGWRIIHDHTSASAPRAPARARK
jgi:ketosteroid isomerase-like protein